MSVEDDILAELQNQTDTLRRMAGGGRPGGGGGGGLPLDSVEDAASNLAGSLYGAGKSVVSTLVNLEENFKDLNSVLVALPFGLGILGGIVSNTVDRYKEFLSIGQTFNGSMLDMAIVANKTSQSMEEMYNLSKAAGGALGVLGLEAVADLSDAVRLGAREFGSFGLTIDETNAYLGEMLETQRMAGSLERMDRHMASRAFNELQIQTMALSSATGKSRDEILKQTLALQKQTPTLTGYISSLPKEVRETVRQSVQTASNVFSALPGDVGDLLSSTLIQGLSTGSVFMSDAFSGVAMHAGGVATALDYVKQVAEAGGDTEQAAIGVVTELQKLSQEQLSGITIMASTGDEAAQSLLKLYQSAQGVQLEELEAAKERANMYGNSEKELLNFNQNLRMVFAEIRGAFLKLISPSLKALGGTGEDGLFTSLANRIRDFVSSKQFELMGEDLLGFASNLVSKLPEIETVIEFLSTQIKTLGQRIGIINAVGDLDMEGIKVNFKEFQAILLRVGASLMEFADWLPGVEIEDKVYQNMRKRAEALENETAALLIKREEMKKLGIKPDDASGELAATLSTFLKYNKESVATPADVNARMTAAEIKKADSNKDLANTLFNDVISQIVADNKITSEESGVLAKLDEANKLTKEVLDNISKQTNITVDKLQEQIRVAKAPSSVGTDQ